MASSTCHDCGGFLSGRAWPAGRWGSWCPRCRGWWPDDDDRPDTRPARWRLADTATHGTVLRRAGPASDVLQPTGRR